MLWALLSSSYELKNTPAVFYKDDWYTFKQRMALLARDAEFTDCFSAEGKDSSNECPVYDTKQSDVEASVMQELWGMRSIPLLLSLPDPPRPWVVELDRVLSMGQIELYCVLMLNWIAWNRTVYMYKSRFGIK